MSLRYVIFELAARHELNAEHLLEDWNERAAIREYDGGLARGYAELLAVHDVEAMHQIGLRCPETRRRMTAGGERMSRRRSA